MITTVTLNPAIDITYSIPDFKVNEIHRVEKTVKEPGGKGLNVAKVIKALNVPVTASGLAGGNNGRFICERLDTYSISHSFEPIKEESRLCLNIIDRTHSQTEILERGPKISSEEFTYFKERLASLAKKSEFVVFSGSLPSGLPRDTYAQLVAMVQDLGPKAIVDTSGEPLKEALKSRPFMVKPNLEELSAIYEKTAFSEQRIWDILEDWQKSGIACSIVSLGSKGLVANIYGTKWRVIPPKVQAVNTVGCGDTLVGAMAAGLLHKEPIETCLINASAAAAANALEMKAGSFSQEAYNRLQSEIKLIKVS